MKNILLVGVGGQGTILAAKILSTGLMQAGYDVKMSEIHGMSQRGGDVSTQIRFGKKVYSPIIGLGEADIVVAFEKMEALRYYDYIKEGATVIINDIKIPSTLIQIGEMKYPEDIIEKLSKKADVKLINASEIALSLGNIKTANIVLLGAMIKSLGKEDVNWEDIISKTVKKEFVDLNLTAFRKGKDYISSPDSILA